MKQPLFSHFVIRACVIYFLVQNEATFFSHCVNSALIISLFLSLSASPPSPPTLSLSSFLWEVKKLRRFPLPAVTQSDLVGVGSGSGGGYCIQLECKPGCIKDISSVLYAHYLTLPSSCVRAEGEEVSGLPAHL